MLLFEATFMLGRQCKFPHVPYFSKKCSLMVRGKDRTLGSPRLLSQLCKLWGSHKSMKLCTALSWEHDKILNLPQPSYPILQDIKHTSPAKPSSKCLELCSQIQSLWWAELRVCCCFQSQEWVGGDHIHLSSKKMFQTLSNRIPGDWAEDATEGDYHFYPYS